MAVKQSATSPMDIVKNNTVLVLVIGLALGGVIGHLWTKVQMLENGAAKVAGTTDTAQAQPQQPEEPKELKIKKPDPSTDHWMGPKDARYVHVEYSDFKCPYGKAYLPTFEKFKEDYADKMAFVYRHFPLSFHPLAQPSAEASECVADLGGGDAFWKFHDIVFQTMPDVKEADLPTLAAKAGVNEASFKECFGAKKFTSKVNDQAKEGESAGVNATPTSVIYDMQTGKTAVIAGAYPYEQAKQIVDPFIQL